MARPVYSSEIYMLAAADVLALPCSAEQEKYPQDDNETVILLGHNRKPEQKDSPDTVLKGRAAVEKAAGEGSRFIPVRLAFIPGNKCFDLLSPLVRKLRYRIRYYGSNVYHMDPKYIRSLKIERTIKTRENAYSFTNPKYRMTQQERDNEYSRIYNSIKENGFDDNEPVDIMLCRLMGAKDCVNNGHHRMGIALELGLETIPVRFSAAGASPRFIRPALKELSAVNLELKRRFGH